MGAEGKFDLTLALTHDPEKLRKDSTTSHKSEPCVPVGIRVKGATGGDIKGNVCILLTVY